MCLAPGTCKPGPKIAGAAGGGGTASPPCRPSELCGSSALLEIVFCKSELKISLPFLKSF